MDRHFSAPTRQKSGKAPQTITPGTQPAESQNTLKGKILVVKLGGSTLENQRMVLRDLIWLQILGVHPVLVHGGGPSIDALLQELHIPRHFEQGLRVTDAQTLNVVCMVLRGQINEQLVLLAAKLGGRAVGLSGTDGNMVQAHQASERLGFVGEIDTVDPTIVQGLLTQGYLPIIAPLGQGPDGCCLNINADLVAASLAQALHAERLAFLSDVPGIRGADNAVINELHAADAQRLIDDGVVSGGMIPKVNACLKALATVSSVHIVDGSEPHILLREIDRQQQRGTMVVR